MSEPGMMLQLNPDEALALIQSLSAQLVSKSPNTGRTEFRTEDNEYFSVAVQQPEIYEPEEMEVMYAYERIKHAGKWEQGEVTNILNKK